MSYEIIFTFIVSFLGADGEEVDITTSFVDGSVYFKCLSYVACSRVGDNNIFLNIWESDQRDRCWRSPLQHELAHFRYLDQDIHSNCNLKADIVRIRSI